MAIDPTIALGVQPVRSPLESYGKALQVQNLATQGKMGQLGLEQAQTSLAQQQALNKAYSDPANRNPDGSINYNAVANSLAQAGAGAQIPGVIKGGMQAGQAQMQFQEEHLKLLQQRNDRMADHIQGLMASKTLTPDQVKATMDQALQEGDLDQAHYQQALQTMPQTNDPNALKSWLAQQAATTYATGAKLQSFLPQTKMQAVGGQLVPVTTTQAGDQVSVGAPVTAAPTTELAKINADEKAGLISAADAAAARRKATYIQPNMFMMMGQGMGTPQQQADSAKLYAQRLIQGQEKWPDYVSLRTDPVIRQGLELARQMDPSFNAATYQQRQKTFQAFTTGKQADTINALNTAMGHAGELSDYAEKLDNTSFQLFNKVKNFSAEETGDPTITAFNTTKKALADEVTKVWRGAGGAESDIQEAMKNLDASQSPAQLRANIYQLTKLMASKQAALEQQYKKAMGNFGELQVLEPESVSALNKIQTRAGAPATGAGRTLEPSAPQQGPTTNLPTAVGPNGHKIVYKNGAWRDANTDAVVQ